MRLCSKALLCVLILSALPAVQVLTADDPDINSVSMKNRATVSYDLVNPAGKSVNLRSGITDTVWNNGMETGGGWQISVHHALYESIIADDFMFNAETNVTGVNWRAVYYYPPEDEDFDWEVIFYEDDGTGTKPGNILATYYLPNADINETFIYGTDNELYYTYSANLPSAYTFDGNTKYWVSFQGQGWYPPATAVNISTLQQLNDFVWKGDYWGYPLWTSSHELSGNYLDICFQLIYTEPCIWNPGDWVMMENTQQPNETGWAVNATDPIVLADDWLSIQTAPIKDIHWWGAWESGIEGEILYFNLSIHEDIPADQSGTGYSMPGEILWERQIDALEVVEINPPDPEHWYDPATGYSDASDHQTYFQYNVCFDDPLDWFFQAEGVIYWLNISAVVADPENTRWGWKSTMDHWNDDAVWAIVDQWNWIEMYEPGPFDYMPGDVTDNDIVDAEDDAYLASYLFGGVPPPYSIPGTDPPFYAAADVNGDCRVDALDQVYLTEYLFEGGPPPTYCPAYPPGGDAISLDLAFVITGDPPIGACCFEDGHCEELEPFNCDAAGGTYRGNSTVCLGDTNPPDGTDDLCAWVCGDPNGTQTVNILDITYIIAYLYLDGPAPEFMASADVNSTGTINILDITYLISFLYLDGPAPDCP